jgi:hypothetical protein
MSSELHDLIEKELQAADVRIEAGGARAAPPARAGEALGVSGGGGGGLAGTTPRRARAALQDALDRLHIAGNRVALHVQGARRPSLDPAPRSGLLLATTARVLFLTKPSRVCVSCFAPRALFPQSTLAPGRLAAA